MRALLFSILLSIGLHVAAADDARICRDKAIYAYFAAQARDNGIPLETYLSRVERLVREHPEYGVPESDIPEMLTLARVVYSMRRFTPQEIMDRVLRNCLRGSV